MSTEPTRTDGSMSSLLRTKSLIRTGCSFRLTTKLYVISTGTGPGDTGPGGKGDIYVFDVGPDNKLSNQKFFTDFMIDGVKRGPDDARCDVDSNLWCSS